MAYFDSPLLVFNSSDVLALLHELQASDHCFPVLFTSGQNFDLVLWLWPLTSEPQNTNGIILRWKAMCMLNFVDICAGLHMHKMIGGYCVILLCWLQVKTTKQLIDEEIYLQTNGLLKNIMNSSTQRDSEVHVDDEPSVDGDDAEKKMDLPSVDALCRSVDNPNVAAHGCNVAAAGCGDSTPGSSTSTFRPAGLGPDTEHFPHFPDKLRPLRAQHFLELYGSLQQYASLYPRHSVYGLYMVDSHIYLTCLKVLGRKKLWQAPLGTFLKEKGRYEREQLSWETKLDLHYKMICSKSVSSFSILYTW